MADLREAYQIPFSNDRVQNIKKENGCVKFLKKLFCCSCCSCCSKSKVVAELPSSDNGLNAIPVDEFVKRLAILQAQRDADDKKLREKPREQAQKEFDDFNNKRNQEVQKEFEKMRKEKGY